MTIIWGLIGLSILVFFHELGHFLAARFCGVKVEAFSIGMGPVLLHRTYKETDYRISLIPVGGYCNMKGEHDYQRALDLNLTEIRGEKDSFYGIHSLKRLLIAFAGPFFNFIIGFLAFFIIALMGYTYYSAGTTVSMADEVYENMVSPAHEAGMQTGDTILSLNGKKTDDFNDIVEIISTNPDKDIVVEFLRNGEKLKLTVHTNLDKNTGTGVIGIVSSADSVVKRNYGPYSFFPAVGEGFYQTIRVISLTYKGFATLFKGIDVTKAVSGPARITSMLGETVQEGFSEGVHIGIVSTLQFLAIISISLFIMNLLPIPIFDGGTILFSLIEFVTKKKMNPKLLYYIQFVGLAFIGLLFVLAVVGDIRYFFFK